MVVLHARPTVAGAVTTFSAVKLFATMVYDVSTHPHAERSLLVGRQMWATLVIGRSHAVITYVDHDNPLYY